MASPLALGSALNYAGMNAIKRIPRYAAAICGSAVLLVITAGTSVRAQTAPDTTSVGATTVFPHAADSGWWLSGQFAERSIGARLWPDCYHQEQECGDKLHALVRRVAAERIPFWVPERKRRPGQDDISNA